MLHNVKKNFKLLKKHRFIQDTQKSRGYGELFASLCFRFCPKWFRMCEFEFG
jgi:hypothetical protein